jgi:hypothetical protein
MISAGNDESRIGQPRRDQIKCLDHEFETFVSSPFTKRQDAMDRRSPSREVGKLRTPRENAVRPQMNIVSPILIIQDLSIAGHKHRYRIRQEQHSRSDSASVAIQPFMSNSHIFQLDCIHQMVQSYVCITAT